MTDNTELKRLLAACRAENCAGPREFRNAVDALFDVCSIETIAALVADNERLHQAMQSIAAEVDGNIRPTVRDCVNGQNNVQDIYGYCDQIESIAAAVMKEPQP